MNSGLYSLLIGTYTEKLPHVDGHAKGILGARFDGRSMSAPEVKAEVTNPSWVTMSADGRFVYAVIETEKFEGEKSGGAAAYARDLDSGDLTLLNKTPSAGLTPAHMALDPEERFVLVANYGSGSVSVFAREKDGRIGKMVEHVQHEGTGTSPHAHQIVFDPVTREVLVPDLGLDTVFVYRLAYDGRLAERPEARIRTAKGAGPRHLAFHPDGRHLFLLNELDSTLIVLRRSGDRFEQVQVISTLPADFKEHNQAGEVWVTDSGKYVLVSNRGADTIAVLAFDAASSKVDLRLTESTRGRGPRDFVLTPDGRHVIAGNQDSDTVVVFAFDEGAPSLTFVAQSDMPTPVCLRFLP